MKTYVRLLLLGNGILSIGSLWRESAPVIHFTLRSFCSTSLHGLTLGWNNKNLPVKITNIYRLESELLSQSVWITVNHHSSRICTVKFILGSLAVKQLQNIVFHGEKNHSQIPN